MGRTNHCRMWSPQENEPPPLLMTHPPHRYLTKQPTRPRIDRPKACLAKLGHAGWEVLLSHFVPEDFRPLDSAPDDMVRRSRGIYSVSFGWNDALDSNRSNKFCHSYSVAKTSRTACKGFILPPYISIARRVHLAINLPAAWDCTLSW